MLEQTLKRGHRSKYIRKAVLDMDKVNVESLMSIFRFLSTELPEELMYRETEDCIELKSLESIRDTLPPESQYNGWNLINAQMLS